MACDDSAAASAALAAAAAGPAEVSVDGQTVRQQPLRDLIEYDRYLAARCAARRRGLPVRFVQLKPPGSA